MPDPDETSPRTPDSPKEARESVKGAPGDEYEALPMEIETSRLMTAVKAGDSDAFDTLVNRLRGRAFGIAQSLVGSRDDAMDMTQETFLKTFRARETFRDGEPFLPWFHQILRNTCFSFLRKSKRVARHSISGDAEEDEEEWALEGEEPVPSRGAEHGELHAVFWRSFQRLGAKDREILSLRHFQELSYKEIAHTLSIPEGTVMSRLFHARRHLRDHLDPHLEGALAGLELERDDNEPNERRGRGKGGPGNQQ